jgi:hypothetical protein
MMKGEKDMREIEQPRLYLTLGDIVAGRPAAPICSYSPYIGRVLHNGHCVQGNTLVKNQDMQGVAEQEGRFA